MSKKSKKIKIAAASKNYQKLLTNAEQKLANQEYGSAAELFSEAVEINPRAATAWHKLGVALYFMADTDKAGVAFAEAAVLDDTNITYSNDLGGIYLAQGRFSEAEKCFLNVLRHEPQSPEARYNLATCFLEQGRYAEAITLLHEVIQQAPDMLDAKFNLGTALRKMNKPAEAIQWLEQSQALSDLVPGTKLELARCYHDLGHFSKARAAYDVLKPSLVDAGVAEEIARIIYLDGDVPAAATYLEEAIQKFSEVPERLKLLLADIWLNNGVLERAEKILDSLIKEGSDEVFSAAANLCVRMRRPGEFHKETLEKLLARLKLLGEGNPEAISIRFTLAELYDNARNYTQAARYYEDANLLRKRTASYDPEAHEQRVSQIIEFFSNEGLARLSMSMNFDSSTQELMPVFIVGMPRAGTTLLEQILASNSDVHSAGELGFLAITASKLAQMFNVKKAYPYCLAELTQNQLQQLSDSYRSLLKRHGSQVKFVTDKMPENFYHIGFIRMLFPTAKIIHVKRNPADTAISIFAQNFERGNDYAWATADIAHYYAQYERLMSFWSSLSLPNLHHFHYEDVISDLEAQSRELIDILKLPWEPASLEYYRNKSDVRTASNWQVRQPIYDSSVGRSNNYSTLKKQFDDALDLQRKRFGLRREHDATKAAN